LNWGAIVDIEAWLYVAGWNLALLVNYKRADACSGLNFQIRMFVIGCQRDFLLSHALVGRDGICLNGRMWLRLVVRRGKLMILSGRYRGALAFIREDVALIDGRPVTVDQGAFYLSVRCRIRSQSWLIRSEDDGERSMAVAAPRAKI